MNRIDKFKEILDSYNDRNIELDIDNVIGVMFLGYDDEITDKLIKSSNETKQKLVKAYELAQKAPVEATVERQLNAFYKVIETSIKDGTVDLYQWLDNMIERWSK